MKAMPTPAPPQRKPNELVDVLVLGTAAAPAPQMSTDRPVRLEALTTASMTLVPTTNFQSDDESGEHITRSDSHTTENTPAQDPMHVASAVDNTTNVSSFLPRTSPPNDTNSIIDATFWPKTSTPRETTPLPTATTPPKVNTAMYAGVGVGVVLCALVLLGYFMRRRQRQQYTSTKLTTLTSQQSSQTLHWHNLNQHQVNIEDIQLIKRLAAGAYGILYLATYQDQLVAVKTCTKTTLPDIQAFFDELALLATLTSPTIVTLVGVAWTKATDLKAVLEYMNMGDLRDVLAKTT
ncbi:hypothetical protein As57867_007983, partial [Aphanomyces stellatus]